MNDAHVIQRLAEQIDPETDIAGIPVTVRVGRLSQEKTADALHRSMEKADELIKDGIILGAFVAVQGKVVMTSFFEDCLVS